MFLREIELELNDEVKSVRLDQQYEGDTGVVVWDAAIVLSKYLETIRDQLRGKCVLELGSGTGAVGICAAALGARQVLLTDQDNLVEFLNHNTSLNNDLISTSSTISALPLVWGNTEQIDKIMNSCMPTVDVILLSDCVFYEESIDDLVATLELLSSKVTKIFMSYEERDSQKKLEVMKLFFEKMKSKFLWRKLSHGEHHSDFQSPDIQIFIFNLL